MTSITDAPPAAVMNVVCQSNLFLLTGFLTGIGDTLVGMFHCVSISLVFVAIFLILSGLEIAKCKPHTIMIANAIRDVKSRVMSRPERYDGRHIYRSGERLLSLAGRLADFGQWKYFIEEEFIYEGLFFLKSGGTGMKMACSQSS